MWRSDVKALNVMMRFNAFAREKKYAREDLAEIYIRLLIIMYLMYVPHISLLKQYKTNIGVVKSKSFNHDMENAINIFLAASGHVKSLSITVGINCIVMSTVLSLWPKRLLTAFLFTIIF